MQTPFRYDFVGSFLRPQRLKDARKDFENGVISQEELTAVEDDCVKELVAKTKELGYHVITDEQNFYIQRLKFMVQKKHLQKM